MSAGLVALKQWIERSLEEVFGGATVHLYGFGNEEIIGGGYAPKAWDDGGTYQFLFLGETPKIYGYYIQEHGGRIYSESFPRPWQALNPGDVLDVHISMQVKVKRVE